MTEVKKYTGLGSEREIFFEPSEELPNSFVKAKRYLNSTFLKTGRFEEYSFHLSCVSSVSEEEYEAYLLLRDQSVHLIGKA